MEAASPAAWTVGAVLVASGAALLLGFFTPLASALVAATALALAGGWVDAPPLNLLESRIAALLVAAIALAAACLGPGAFSIDARLFGRREVLIRP